MMPHRSYTPIRCLEEHPRPNTVYLRNTPINLAHIEKATGIRKASLSRVFAGKRKINVDSLELIAAALGMETGDFLKAFRERLKFIGNPWRAKTLGHDSRGVPIKV